ncbi:MAG: septum formation initiator family protein [Desulfobacteraceae bacterium]|nr:septum formation initiator family protein [Desulfobacteraceae bacterium]
MAPAPPAPRNRRTAGTLSLWALMMVFFMGEVYFYTWCRVQCTQIGYEITRAADHYQRLQGIQSSLKIELERLKSPQRIARYAREKLGLEMPNRNQVIIMP